MKYWEEITLEEIAADGALDHLADCYGVSQETLALAQVLIEEGVCETFQQAFDHLTDTAGV